ncbi:SDR family NAD(P)-dependent oxidoreductase [Nonomuraea sp. NPDC050536]|uniref:SDR family NAD(P)-dependent oxidoreductase n=1 Tax=Nonomuraea sp. NPDC050536 TaxID=3364366 RepID=UPI0037C7843A
MKMKLDGKSAIVAGASRGIGLAIARLLISEGVKVLGAARGISAPLAELKDAGAIPLEVDLTAPDGPTYLIEQARLRLPDIDFLVNNIGGIEAHHGDLVFGTIGDKEWQVGLERNLMSAITLTRLALPCLLERRGATVHISSVGGRQAGLGPLHYTVPKAALRALSKGIAVEYGHLGLRSNLISLGPVATSRWESAAAAAGVSLDELMRRMPRDLRMVTGHMITPDEVAGLTAYLLSPWAASITGADYTIDGGMITTI